MKRPLFSYGTLEFSEIIELITGKKFDAKSATLNGYARYKLENEKYPGIISQQNAQTKGTVYFDIEDEDLQKIDRYEDTCYQRQMVSVITEDNQTVDAMAYVVPEEKSNLLSTDAWDRQHFMEHDLPAFIRAIGTSH